MLGKARQKVERKMWHKRRWQIRCRATGGHIKVVVVKRTKRDKKKHECKLENEVTQVNVGAEVINTWVIHHP